MSYVGSDRLTILSEHHTSCPNCGREAVVTVSEYKASDEILVILTLKCYHCHYKKSDVITVVDKSGRKCLEIFVREPEDLNTIVYVPPGSSIEVPEISVKIDFSAFSDTAMGSYVTVDSILLYILERLEFLCSQVEGADAACKTSIDILENALERQGSGLTIRVVNSYGGIAVVKTYRDNYRWCKA